MDLLGEWCLGVRGGLFGPIGAFEGFAGGKTSWFNDRTSRHTLLSSTNFRGTSAAFWKDLCLWFVKTY